MILSASERIEQVRKLPAYRISDVALFYLFLERALTHANYATPTSGPKGGDIRMVGASYRETGWGIWSKRELLPSVVWQRFPFPSRCISLEWSN